jgi:hypothetical protein
VKNNPTLVDVDLSLAYFVAESTRNVFGTFPAFLLTNQEICRRSSWFSTKAPSKTKDARRTNIRFEIQGSPLCHPPIDILMKCLNEHSLKQALIHMWYVQKYKRL